MTSLPIIVIFHCICNSTGNLWSFSNTNCLIFSPQLLCLLQSPNFYRILFFWLFWAIDSLWAPKIIIALSSIYSRCCLVSNNILGLWASIHTALNLLTLIFAVLSSLGLLKHFCHLLIYLECFGSAIQFPSLCHWNYDLTYLIFLRCVGCAGSVSKQLFL